MPSGNYGTTTSIIFYTLFCEKCFYILFYCHWKKSVNFDCFEYNMEFEKSKTTHHRGIVEVMLFSFSRALNQQFRPISLTNWWINHCIPHQEKRAFYNNWFWAARFEIKFAITNLVHENQACAYSKQRGQGWWRALSMASRQPRSWLFQFQFQSYAPFLEPVAYVLLRPKGYSSWCLPAAKSRPRFASY